MKLLIDIPNDLNKKLKIYKAENDLLSLQNALLEILTVFFDMPKRRKK